jgi:hypothetical protein
MVLIPTPDYSSSKLNASAFLPGFAETGVHLTDCPKPLPALLSTTTYSSLPAYS